MAVLRAQVETERPGIVTVRAKSAPGREMDARPIAGFFVRRRYEGEQFKISDWREFSPRWMEFIDTPPSDWLDNIKVTEGCREDFIAKAELENARSPRERMAEQVFSMLSMMKDREEKVLEHSTGRIKPKSSV